MSVTLKTHTDYDMEHLEELQRVMGKTIVKKQIRRKRVSGMISGGLSLAIGIALAIRHDSVGMSLVCCAFGVWLLARSALFYFFTAWSASRAMGKKNVSNEFLFQRDGVLAVCGSESTRFAYTDCRHLIETAGNFYFIMENAQGLMLDKANVKGGSIAELRALLEEKCEKKALWVGKKSKESP